MKCIRCKTREESGYSTPSLCVECTGEVVREIHGGGNTLLQPPGKNPVVSARRDKEPAQKKLDLKEKNHGA